MRVRCEMLSARRGRVLHLLHGLWTRLAALGGTSPAAEAAELERLDALRQEIESELIELRTMLADGPPTGPDRRI
jgi:hypothetical protein